MDAIEAVMSRTSPPKLSEPGPDKGQLDAILAAGQTAPDHGRLQPWRFIVMEGDARNVLAKTMSDMRRRATPDATEEMLAKDAAKAFRAPTIIAVGAAITPGKIPEIEQVMAVSAAVENMWLVAHAMGLGAMWKTGAAAYDTELKSALGLSPTDHIVAFLYLGTRVDMGAVAPKRPKDVVRYL